MFKKTALLFIVTARSAQAPGRTLEPPGRILGDFDFRRPPARITTRAHYKIALTTRAHYITGPSETNRKH